MLALIQEASALESEAAGGPNPTLDAGALARLEPDAVAALYRELFDDVYTFAYYRVGRVHADAEDVTQDTFLIALRSIGTYRGRSPLRTWLFGIARNRAREKLRERARSRIEPRNEEVERTLANLGAAFVPADLARAEEASNLVGAALAELPPAYRDALVEKYVNGRSLREIAKQTERSEKAVESLVVRARRAFADLLERLARGEG